MKPDERKPGAAPQAQEGEAQTPKAVHAGPRPDAVSLLNAIQDQQRVKSPELAAKQARLLALLKAETPPPVPKVWADDDPNRPETEEDGIRARAVQIAQWRYQAQQQRARAQAAAAVHPADPLPPSPKPPQE